MEKTIRGSYLIRRITSLQKVPSLAKLYRMETLVREGGGKLFSKNELFEKEELCIVIFRCLFCVGEIFNRTLEEFLLIFSRVRRRKFHARDV